MPVKECQSDGKPGYKWGDEGKCYTYDPDDKASRKKAKDKATKQGQAIKSDDNNLDLILGTTIDFSDDDADSEELPLTIKGKSMHSGYIQNKGVILPSSELDNIVNTLKSGFDGQGAYILKDHGYKGGLFSPKSVDLVIGRITDALKDGRNVFYEGRIEDEDMANKIRRKLVSASSIGLHIESFRCSICGRDFDDPDCNHRWGEVYEDEGLHEIAEEYIDDMGGKPTCAIVAEDIQALEQSIVLFPAIDGANVQESMLNFSQDTKDYIDTVDSSKDIDFSDSSVSNKELKGMLELLNDNSNNDEIVKELLKNIEGFNKDLYRNIYDDKMEKDFEELMGEMTDLKADKKLLEAEVTKLEAKVETLDNSVTTKDEEISELEDDLESANSKIETQKELLEDYKTKDEQRAELHRQKVITELNKLREEKGLEAKDYSDMKIDLLESQLEILTEFGVDNTTKGKVGDDDDPTDTETLKLTAKEDIREMIFHKRKDDEALKGIRREDDLTVRVE